MMATTRARAAFLHSFHVIATAHFVLSLVYDQLYVNIPNKVPEERRITFFKGRLVYLTLWNMMVQSAFYAVCAVADVAITSRPLQRLRDSVFTCIAFPVSMFVGVTFWALYAVDRELVFPRALDPYFPTWLNHVMHTNIMVFSLLEMWGSKRVYPSRKRGLFTLLIFMVTYLVWMHVVYYNTGVWVYPVMEVLNLPLRLCFFLALLGGAVSLYIFGEKLNAVFWPDSKKLK